MAFSQEDDLVTGTFMAPSPPHTPRFKQSLTIWPHRSLSKRGFVIVMAALGSLAFFIGLGFFLLGAWPVIGFLGLEVLVVWGAFKLNYRAAKQRQKLTATERELIVENVAPSGETDIIRMSADWLRVEVTPKEPPEMSSRYRQRVYVTSHGKRTEIGGFLHPVETSGLAAEISTMLERARDVRTQTSESGLK